MATQTFANLYIPEAATLADLSGISWDLRCTREFAELLVDEFSAEKPNFKVVESLSIAITVTYSRSFASGVRSRLENADLAILSTEQRAAHDYLRAYRDKHVAHSVNAFEENRPRVSYCLERVKEEGITGITCGGRRIVGLSSVDLENVIKLTTILQAYVDAKITKEQERLLVIVRNMPLEEVLAGGQKGFVVDTRTAIN